MTNLPQGWEVKKLGEIGEIVTGLTPSKNNLDFYGKDYPFFKPSDFKQGYFLENAVDNLSELGFEKAKQLPSKTILVVCIGSLGKVALTRVIGSCNQQINAIIPHKNIIAEFIYYYCISSKFQSILFLKAPQTTLPILNKTEFSKLEIIYPKDIKEQERIVGILDESFAKIDESIKILEQDLLNLDELMQSALQKAFNPLKDNAKENYKLPQGWEWKSLGEICEINPRNKIDDEINVSFVSMNKILDGYSNEFSYAIKKWKDVKNGFTHFKQGDIGLAKITPCFENKKSVIFDVLENGVGAGTTELHVIRAVDNVISKFLLWFFKTEKFIQNGILNMTGATGHKRIPKDFIKNLQIPLPPLQEQEQIASHLDELFSHVKNLKQNYQMQIKNLQELKKSLLDKAFQGRL